MSNARVAAAWLVELSAAALTLVLALAVLYVIALETRLGGSLGGVRLLALLPVVAPLCGTAAFGGSERLRGRRPSRARSVVAAVTGSAVLGAAAVIVGSQWLDFLGAFAGLFFCVPGAALGLAAERRVPGNEK